MSDSKYRNALRRTAVEALRIAADDLEKAARNHPSHDLAAGQAWSVNRLRTLARGIEEAEK